MAASEDAAARTPLDKPLHLLTEDDISQVTREDCRRYLKSKGMRRPSWNKSQAIQQVISLKTLLEPAPKSDTNLRKLYIPPPPNHRVPLASSASAEVSAEDSLPCRKKNPEKSAFSGDSDSVSPRNTGAANMQVSQMTIFYCGRVNVYDNVPGNKAQAILQLAASPFQFTQEAPFDAAKTAFQSFSSQVQPADAKLVPSSPMRIFSPPQTVKVTGPREENHASPEENSEVPTNRKASVQRYLEKRKDRFKSKRRVGSPSSGSLEIYLNHRMNDQALTEHSSLNDACSPPQVRPPPTPTRCSSTEDMAKVGNFSADLNCKDALQCGGNL